jgi:phosphatidate cytidylyltransferase
VNLKKRMADFNIRLVVSSFLVIFVSILIAFSTYQPVSAILVLCVALIASVGVWEYVQLIRAKRLKVSGKLMMALAFCLTIAFFLSQKYLNSVLLPLAVITVGVLLFFVAHFKDTTNALVHIALEFFGVCYVTLPLCFLLGILYPLTNHPIAQDGRWWLGYLIIVTKITDVGAYFVGRLWGKHKLAPILSPKKTVEGAIAGFFSAVGASVLLYWLGKRYSQGMFDLTLPDAIWLGMLIGIVGQVGDLAESMLKRDAYVKDSNTLPGIGGVLDLLDSLLFTSPIVFLYLRMHSL